MADKLEGKACVCVQVPQGQRVAIFQQSQDENGSHSGGQCQEGGERVKEGEGGVLVVSLWLRTLSLSLLLSDDTFHAHTHRRQTERERERERERDPTRAVSRPSPTNTTSPLCPFP